MNDVNSLIEYATILSNYQHGNYKLNDLEKSKIETIRKSADLKTQIEVDKINKMTFSEREKYIEELKKKQDTGKEKASSNQEEIALTFGVDVSKIKENRLKSGKTIYSFFYDKIGKNVVLQSSPDQPLTVALEELRKESLEDVTIEGEQILEDQRVKQNLEVEFVSVLDIGRHLSEVATLRPEERRNLKFLLDNASDFGIVAVNIENMLGMDSYGNVFEVSFDKNKCTPVINSVDENKNLEVNEELKTSNGKDNSAFNDSVFEDELDEPVKEDNTKEENNIKDNQLEQMLQDDSEIQKQEIEEVDIFENKNSSAKVLEREIPSPSQNQSEE